jgi:hypothetical protein
MVRDIIAVYRENHTEHVNTMRWEKSIGLWCRSENHTLHYTKNVLLSKILLCTYNKQRTKAQWTQENKIPTQKLRPLQE